MKARGRRHLFLTIYFLVSLIAMFIMGQTAHAEDSSQGIIKESPEQTSNPVVRPSRERVGTDNIKIGPSKKITPQRQTQHPDRSETKHGESVSSSNDKLKIEIGPVKKISPAAQEKVKTGDDVRGRHRRSVPETGEIIKIEPISKPKIDTDNIKTKVSPAIPIEQPEKGDKKFEVQISPAKEIESNTGNTETIQPPLQERVKVTGAQSWKLDKSGNKTNEPTTDNMTVIEEINRPPSDLNNE